MDNNQKQIAMAVVEFDYAAKEPDELTLRKGDILHSIKCLPGGWWEGTLGLGGRTGMFPDNFVRVVNPADIDTPVQLREKPGRKKCRVVFSYEPNNDDELALSVGDIIEVLGEVEEGWWRGKQSTRVGVFPSNFVVAIENSPVSVSRVKTKSETKTSLHSGSGSKEDLTAEDAPLLPPKPVREICRALFPYEAANDDELSLSEGDIITILSRDVQDKGWWRGELRGHTGVFPDNFVQIIPDLSASKDSNSLKKLDRHSSANKLTSRTPSPASQSLRKDSFGSKQSTINTPIQGTVAATRKSLENKTESEEKKNPPLPGKKPSVPIKKSPISTLTGGLLAGFKQKVKDVDRRLSNDSLDGASSSKLNLSNPPSNPPSNTQVADMSDKQIIGLSHAKSEDTLEFDQVERAALLQDPRALRPKAPGRRPPTQTIKDTEAGIMNGNAEHMVEPSAVVKESEEVKPKTREWEKHKAPWMAELKLNQEFKAKKVSPSDVVHKSPQNLDKMHSVDIDPKKEDKDGKKENLNPLEMSKSMSAISTRVKIDSPPVEVKKEIDMSKSMSSIMNKMSIPDNSNKVTDNEPKKSNVTLRNRSASPLSQPITNTPLRPVAISTDLIKSNISNEIKQEKISPVILRTNASNLNRPSSMHLSSEKINDSKISSDLNSSKHIQELNERILQLERLYELQNNTFKAAIEELTNRLETEIEKRHLLQAELEKLAQCVTQV